MHVVVNHLLGILLSAIFFNALIFGILGAHKLYAKIFG